MSCAIEINSFQNFEKVPKTCSEGQKDFFDTLIPRRTAPGDSFLCLPFHGDADLCDEFIPIMGEALVDHGNLTGEPGDCQAVLRHVGGQPPVLVRGL